MTWALKDSAPLGGSFLESPATLPRRISLTDTFLTLKPTLSPGRPSTSCSWCISTDLTSVVTPAGAKVTTIPAIGISHNKLIGRTFERLTLDGTSLHTTDRHSSNTTNLVNVLKRQTERLVSRTTWWVNGINSLKKSLASSLGLGFLLPTLVPWTVGGWLDHIVTIETRDGDKWDVLRIVADLLDKVGGFLNNFVVTILGPLGGVHLVDGDNELFDTEGIGE